MRGWIFIASANPSHKTKAEEMLIFAAKSWNFLVLVLSVFILCKITTTNADHLSERCTGAANYTANSTFENNLKILLSSISTDSPSKGFYNGSAGEDPDRVFGLGLCRGDANEPDCQTCLSSAMEEVEEVCPNKKKVVIWFQKCMIRFSDVQFFGTVDAGDRVLMWNPPMNESESDDSRINGRDLLDRLAGEAVASPLLFAKGNLTYTGGETKYGLVQCTRDLSAGGCKECLEELMEDLEGCCRGKKEWRILAGSCFLRYDAYYFFDNTSSSNGNGGHSGNGIKIVIIAIVSTLVVAAVLVASVFFVCRRKRKQKAKEKENYRHAESAETSLRTYKSNETSLPYMKGEDDGKAQELPLIDLGTIETATAYFGDSSKLGEGGFGPVYKGVLPDGKEIAVKRLSKSSVQGLEEFRNEISLIARLQHRNLVKLLYCCIERAERLLVYEYMPNTSLDVFLFDPDRRVELDWSRRHNIVMGIAKGLVYLHEDSRLRIIHRDLKASNVLLDEEMNPKISDFGMARIFGGNGSGYNTSRIVGTFGYMAPEYALEGLFSVKSDVFSFGVLLLEIVSGQKNHGFSLSQHDQNLLAYAWRSWSEGKGMDMIDPLLIDLCPTNEVLRWVHIGLLCVQEDPAERPTMSKAVLMLGSENVKLPKPTKPVFSVRRRAAAISQSSSYSAQTSSLGGLTITDMGPR